MLIMQEMIKFILGIIVLALGFPIGNYLAKNTKEELKSGQIWFKLIMLVGFAGAIIGLIIRNDVLMFTFLFIIVVTSRSLVKGKVIKKKVSKNKIKKKK